MLLRISINIQYILISRPISFAYLSKKDIQKERGGSKFLISEYAYTIQADLPCQVIVS